MYKQEFLWDISNLQNGQSQNILNKLHQKFKEKSRVGKENEFQRKVKPKPKINNESINNLYFAETKQPSKSRCSKLQIAITDTHCNPTLLTNESSKTPNVQGKIIEAILQSTDFVTHRSPSSKNRTTKFGIISTKSAMHSKLGTYPQSNSDNIENCALSLKNAKLFKCSVLKTDKKELLIIKGNVIYSYIS